jgi:hypothetical protein
MMQGKAFDRPLLSPDGLSCRILRFSGRLLAVFFGQ